MSDELKEEMATYEAHLPEWTEQEGRFVVIRGTEVVDFFETYEKALRTGYVRFGVVPFLVKQVRRKRQALFVTRMVAPHMP